MGPFASLFKSNARKKGSEAVEETIVGFEDIIQDLNSALTETENERIEATIAVGLAVNERERIEEVLSKGTKFISGLRTLLQG